jgi:uncharacterized lipoprotein YmbA
MRLPVLKHVSLLILLLMLAACGGGGTLVRYYLVDPVEYPDVPAAGVSDIAIEILEVQVPQYLERFHIATRSEANRLRFAETNQWGENLRKNLMRTLARNLSVLLGTNDVSTPLNRSMSIPDFRIQVHIEQFERDSDGIVRLVARWQVSGSDNKIPLTTLKAELQGSTRLAEDDYDNIVATMQQLYGQLSQKIADAVRAAATTQAST